MDGQCKKCPTGQYKDGTNFQSCQLCPAGYHSSVEGSTSISNCTKCQGPIVCPAGTPLPIADSLLDHERNVYGIVDPQYEATDELQFGIHTYIGTW
jgi:hypothetical protein